MLKKRVFGREEVEFVFLNDEIKNPNVDNLPISTITMIGISNWNLNIKKLYRYLPLTRITLPLRRKIKGRRKKFIDEKQKSVTISESYIKPGSIITIKYQGDIKGIDVKQKEGSPYFLSERKLTTKPYFPNSLTIAMMLEKIINIKISNHGKFQMTGCKSIEHAELCIRYLYQHILNIKDKENDECKKPIISIKDNKNPMIIFKPVMINKDFNLGFLIDRKNLDSFINKKTDYFSNMETSTNYTGVNIKVPAKLPEDILLISSTFKDGTWKNVRISYEEYLSHLTDKDREKELNKVSYHTFLIFRSGNAICSTPFIDEMRRIFPQFFNLLISNRSSIEERLFER
jgi:hypothetical protein